MSSMVQSAPPENDVLSQADAEWAARCDLAAAYQLIDLYGMSDLAGTHISARIPGPEHHFLLNPKGVLFDQITASSLVKVDLNGCVIGDGDENSIIFAGFVIHGAIHMSSPHLTCALHTHTVANNAVGSMEEGLLPLTQKALQTLPFVRYHDYEGAATSMDERERLLSDLGDGRAMLLRNHGALTVGESVAEAWVWMYRLEMSCRMQVAALSCAGAGLTPIKLSDEVVQLTKEQGISTLSSNGTFPAGKTEWPSLLRKLERERGTSYRS